MAPEPTRVMIDIETLGNDPDAAILSIGAVEFDRGGAIDGQQIHQRIALESSVEAGLSVEVETLKWWLKQDDDAQAVLMNDGVELADALQLLSEFVVSNDADEIWANSPAFDCVILETAFNAVDHSVPWEYWQCRDYRTLRKVVPSDGIDVESEPTHDALDDAIAQADIAGQLLEQLAETDE